MTCLFGYLLPESSPDQLQAYVRYVVRLLPDGADSGYTFNATNEGALSAGWRPGAFDGLLIALSGRPIWRGDVIDVDDARVPEALAKAYRKSAAALIENLEGPFALTVIDPKHQALLLAVDRMGIERITYAVRESGIIFGTSASAVSRFPQSQSRIRQQALYDFLFMHMVPSPQTVFEGINKLPPAHALLFEGGRCRTWRYWKPEYNYASPRQFKELQASLKSSLMTAVSASSVDDETGAFLSGGLDSSSVTGMLARQSSKPAKCFTVGFGEASYDELSFARVASRHFGCEAHEYVVTPSDIVEMFPRIATTYDEPFGNSSAVPTFFCAKQAADHGVTHLLAGDGGDELFGGNERYAKQQVFDFYRRVPSWFRREILEPVMSPVSSEGGILPLRKLKSYMEQAQVPLPERFATWNYMYREGRTGLLDPEFSASVDQDAPLRLMRDVWEAAPSENIVERMLWYDWQFTLADNDLRKVSTMCELAGVRVSYPMLHPDVVKLSTRVPPTMKMRHLQLRTFFREAMSDFLPKETLSKQKHGFGLPFGEWLKTDETLRDLVYSLLSDLKKRRIVSSRFLSDLVDEHAVGHASYYGYAIWDLAMLEAWMAHHVDAVASG